MADQQLLTMLKKGVKGWNKWQRQHANMYPDFSSADLAGAQLSFAQLQRADLHGAKLSQAYLCNANLRYADLSGADLRFANLSHANLSYADLTGADLSHARLPVTNLNRTLFRETILMDANLRRAVLQHTIFANVDLSAVRGLDTCNPLGPSSIGLDTISRTKNVSETFLRAVGVHKNLLTAIQEQGKDPFDYFSIFISYASQDSNFVQNLCGRLRQAGVRCWFAPDTLRTGDFFKAGIEQGIKECDKLLVILSRHALESEWVRYEVELARHKEKKKNSQVIMPIKLDKNCLNETGWAAFLKDKRHIRDFTQWQSSKKYHEALNLLLRDLTMAI